MEKFLREVASALRPHRDPRRARASSHIINTKLEYWGLPVPIQRRVFRHGFSFSALSADRQSKIWDYIWQHSQVFEVMKQPLFYFESQIGHNTINDWQLLKSWASKIENWEHSDNYAKIVADLHERFPAQIYPTLHKWNSSVNPWLRRLSVTSLFCYSTLRCRQPPLSRVLSLVRPLLEDRHPYVAKAVGWTLREAGNVYPEQIFRFLKQNAPRLAAVSFSYATEKISPSRKALLKKLRKPSAP